MIAVTPLWESATAINATAFISKIVDQIRFKGYCGILVIIAGAGPSLDITQTVAMSGTDTFYAPYDTMGTAVGTIYTALTATRWIQFSPVVAPHVKITITGDGSNGADTTVQAYLMFDEEQG